MPILDPNAQQHQALQMVLLLPTAAGSPPLVTNVPHVVVNMKRNEASLRLVQYEAVQALKTGALLMAPAGDTNFITNAMRAAYNYTASFKGTRSLLRGWPGEVELSLVMGFVPPDQVHRFRYDPSANG